jgi:hypothetical protein
MAPITWLPIDFANSAISPVGRLGASGARRAAERPADFAVLVALLATAATGSVTASTLLLLDLPRPPRASEFDEAFLALVFPPPARSELLLLDGAFVASFVVGRFAISADSCSS